MNSLLGISLLVILFVYRSANQAPHALSREVVSLLGRLGRVVPSSTLISDVISTYMVLYI